MKGFNVERKRSKLGYHRTSVACVHCRRRKIRCEVAPDDPQGRCMDCIKLKKECQYFPVDQQPPAEKKTRRRSAQQSTSSSSATGPPSTTFTSVPAATAAITKTDHAGALSPYQPLSPGAEVSSFNTGSLVGNQTPSTASVDDQNVASPADYIATPPSLDPSAVSWNDFTTTMSDAPFIGNHDSQQQQQQHHQIMSLQQGLLSPGSSSSVGPVSTDPSTPLLLGHQPGETIQSPPPPQPLPPPPPPPHSAFTMQLSANPAITTWPASSSNHSNLPQPTRSASSFGSPPVEFSTAYTTGQFPLLSSPLQHQHQHQHQQPVIPTSPDPKQPNMAINNSPQSPPNPNPNFNPSSSRLHPSFPTSPPMTIHPSSPPPPPGELQTSPPILPINFTPWHDLNNMTNLDMNMNMNMNMNMDVGMDVGMNTNMNMNIGLGAVGIAENVNVPYPVYTAGAGIGEGESLGGVSSMGVGRTVAQGFGPGPEGSGLVFSGSGSGSGAGAGAGVGAGRRMSGFDTGHHPQW